MANQEKKEPLYTHDLATNIVEKFEDVLDAQDITLTSLEDDDKDDDIEARLYGSTYSNLLDTIEAMLIETLNKYDVPMVTYVYSDHYDEDFVKNM